MEQPIEVVNVYDLVSEATGVSKRSCVKISEEGKQNNGHYHSPTQRYSVSRKRIIVDEFDRAAIRRTIHNFFIRKEYPTLNKVLAEVRDKEIFNGCRTTLWKIIHEIGFKYKVINDRKSVVEQLRVVMQRHSYFKCLRKYREEGRNLIFLDETWVNAHHRLHKCWTDSDGTAFSVKSGKGGRLIVLHAGWKEDWIPNCCDIFRGKTGSGDYHTEMNIQHFMEVYHMFGMMASVLSYHFGTSKSNKR